MRMSCCKPSRKPNHLTIENKMQHGTSTVTPKWYEIPLIAVKQHQPLFPMGAFEWYPGIRSFRPFQMQPANRTTTLQPHVFVEYPDINDIRYIYMYIYICIYIYISVYIYMYMYMYVYVYMYMYMYMYMYKYYVYVYVYRVLYVDKQQF